MKIPTDKRFLTAIDKAQEAFWASISESYPECQTGDFSPEGSFAFEEAQKRAVTEWLYWNSPNRVGEEVK